MSEPVKTAEEKTEKDKTPESKDGQEVAKAEEDFSSEGSLFSLRRPKDIRDGLGSGVGNILKGAVGGAALLVTAPIKGAYDGSSEGSWGALKGFGAGLGIGVVGGVGMVVGGAVTGVTQIGRGIYHTPGAVSAASSGKEWDDERREWYIYNLEEEAKSVLTVSEEDFLKSLKTDPAAAAKEGATGEEGEPVRVERKVADTEFYDVLGVPSNATASEIKKAYYKKARDNHPDRHPDDPEAQKKFQVIGHAYQILSDDALRANYDASGKDSVESAPKVDPSTLFAMIFGSEKFVPLVGELKLASQMQDEENEAHNHPKLKKFRQKKREVQCAMNLVQKLQHYIDLNGDAEAFKATFAEELKELSASPFGSTLVGSIGLAYYESALAELSTVDSVSISLTQAGRSVTTGLGIASEGFKAAMVAREVSNAQKLQKLKEEQKAAVAAGTTASGEATAAAGDAKPSGATVDAGSKTTPSAAAAGAAAGAGPSAAATTAAEEEASAKVAEAAMKEKVERLSGHMFAVMWYFTDIDIRSTLANVCFKVLHDHSVSNTVLNERAKALKILGDCFIAKGGSMSAGLGDVRTRLHQQMNGEGKESTAEEEEAHLHQQQQQQEEAQAHAKESVYVSKEEKNSGSEGSKGESSPVVTPVFETSEADLD